MRGCGIFLSAIVALNILIRSAIGALMFRIPGANKFGESFASLNCQLLLPAQEDGFIFGFGGNGGGTVPLLYR